MTRLSKQLPTALSTTLGPVPVVSLTPPESKDLAAFGLWDYQHRVLSVAAEMPTNARWQTFWHEVAHVALWDAGACNSLTKKQEEIVADAIGGFLAQMMIAGQLKVSPTWDSKTKNL